MKKKYVYLPLLIFVITIIFTGGLVFAHGGTKESKTPNNYLSKIQTKIDLAVEEGKINNNDIVVLAAFGAGFYWGSIVMRWCE